MLRDARIRARSEMMKTHEFTIVASGLDPEMEGYEDRFFAAGCDDATLAFQKGVIIAEFSRVAVSFSKAVASAYEDILKTGAKVERVEPDHLVSLSDIAERSGLTRQAISLYTKAERGSGFPNPVARVTSNSPLWDWLEVSEWLHAHARIDREAVVNARIVKEANRFLELHGGLGANFTRRLEMREAA
jgi:predicted DNA-binding transcriptional regulator AlpA